jgi:hypothetical protein
LIEKWALEIEYEKTIEIFEDIAGYRILTTSGIQSYLERKVTSISKVWLSERRSEITQIEVSTRKQL